MLPLEEQVNSRDDAAGRHADHRRIVADADRSQRAGRHPGGERRDDAPLAQVGNRPAGLSDRRLQTRAQNNPTGPIPVWTTTVP